MTTVAELLSHLDARIPFAWAEQWDRVGLLAGEHDAQITKVLVTLDPTIPAIVRAQALGANVLLTHHPAFLDPLDAVVESAGPGGIVFEAVRRGVSLVNCHTNLDRSPEGSDSLADVLGLEMVGPLEEAGEDASRPQAGRICEAPRGMTLGSLVALVRDRLGVRPRAWGDAATAVRTIGIAPGSGGSLVDAALAAGCDVLLTGELRYHGSLAALDAGLPVVEAGHDATEWPLTRALARIAAETIGLAPDDIVLDEVPCPWWVG